MPEPEPLTVGTAGHVDHGKTALVEALTGTDTDRLEEERRRGLSIELGFAQLVLPNGRALSIVDVPGHECFVRTMVAGASGIDLYLLVVAADDGVMPQTREHIAVLRALGIDHGVVALTKRDLVDVDRAGEVTDHIRRVLPEATVVPTSTVRHEGLTKLRSALAQTAAVVGSAGAGVEHPRAASSTLHIDRVFTLHGIGTVVTGTLRGGSIARGQVVVLLPQQRQLRVRSIHVHDRLVERAEPRQRVALNLAGVTRRDVQRGDVLIGPEIDARGVAASYRADVVLSLEAKAPSLTGKRVQIHHGTREAPARVVYLDGRGRFAQLRLESPILALPGDRVVLRSVSPPGTLGGAEIIDPVPRRHGPGQRTRELELIADGRPADVIVASLTAGTSVPLDLDRWSSLPNVGLALHRHSRRDWLDAMEEVAHGGGAVQREGLLLARGKRRLHQVEKTSAVELSADDRAVLELLRADGPRPRATSTIADALGLDRASVGTSIKRLRAARRVVVLGHGVVYEQQQYDRVRAKLVALIEDHGGSIALAEARDGLSTTRKYAQALLEHLDSGHTTLRRGDRHHLRSHLGWQGSGGPAGLQSQ